mgnify:CR=1 FL=1
MRRLGLVVALACGTGCLAGEVQDRFASVVDAYTPAPFADAAQPYADPDRALGPPDGRTVALGQGSVLVLRFFRDIPDGRGPDLRVVEIGPDGAHASVAVSADGTTFSEFPTPASAGATSEYDRSSTGLSKVSFVRIRGLDDQGLDPGFDLDAVEALH